MELTPVLGVTKSLFGIGEFVMSRADDLRQQAKDAGKRANESRSLQTSVTERKRQKGLEQLADNEDWLDGKAPQADRLRRQDRHHQR